MSQFGPPVPSHGPLPAKIMLLAEAPGERETELGKPLVGPSGYELRRMLNQIGVSLDDCFRANVFSRRPEGNNLHLYCHDDPERQYRDLGPLAANPLGWMDRAHLPDLDRLAREIAACDPNVVVALGNTATWALGLGLGINSLRGSVHTYAHQSLGRSVKVLPTFHPAAVLRQWDLRTIALTDLEKAVVESRTPLLTFDNSELWLNPTLDDLREFDSLYMDATSICASDIETKRGQITAISFSPRPDVSLCIPFWVADGGPNYWPTASEEALAWSYVRRWIERPDLTKVFQNGLFDLQYLSGKPYNFRPRACTEDTMLAHHSLYSELRKGLGFLGSVYANVPSWKSMRTFKKEEQLKRDE